MKAIALVILLFILIQDNSLLSEENYLIIDNFDEILLNGAEYEIQNEIIKIQLSEKHIHYNFKAILKGESEFYYNINNELLGDNLDENSFSKILEKSFILNYSYQEHLLNNGKKQYIYINIKEPEKHKVILKIESPLGNYDSLFAEVTEDYCKNVINNIKGLLENAYVFSDYAKNPKQIEGFPNYFEKIDPITDLDNIETKNRKYYEFYREIEEVLGKYKDIHLNIMSSISPNNVLMGNSLGCLLFSFKIKIDENGLPKLYIIEHVINLCPSLYTTDQQNFILENNGEPLLKINGNSPFDFIQNFPCNKFRQSKNRHATFSFRINTYQAEAFTLAECPLLKEELSNIKFELENGKSITLDYQFLVTVSNTFTKNFNDFYFELLKNNSYNINIPKLFDVEQKYFHLNKIVKENRLKQNINNLQISWNVEFEDSDNVIKFKCRFDSNKNLNVFYQNSFLFQSVKDAEDKFFKCIDLFYTNNHPIVIIQSRNPGGYVDFALFLIQLLQPRIANNLYISFKSNQFVLNNYKLENSKVKTCESSLKNRNNEKETDDYGENIKHIRTPIYNYFNKDRKKIIQQFRNNVIKSNNSRKPTDILIFTDSFSYSATSIFIKGIHNEGGAIIAGFLGNPDIIGTDEFDNSQSPSTVHNYENTKYCTELGNLGFTVNGVTTGETFLNPYEKNQAPIEYQLNPVDERINFYQPYAEMLDPDNDENYNVFVDEALKIFTKYKTRCNPKNKKLTLFTDECNTFKDDKYAHGGKECGDDGKWSDKCIPIYCEMGYYYDDYTSKCIKDVCLNDGKMINNKIINLLLLSLIILF